MYHKSGTFVEVMPDGTKSTKIIGSDYEITLKDKDLQVSGNLNITVNGDAKFLVQGDKYEEIEGNYFLSVRKDKIENNKSPRSSEMENIINVEKIMNESNEKSSFSRSEK